MIVAKILEVIMYVLFGCSWPFNIAKSVKTKSTKGKSLIFLILIDVGYVASMLSKIISSCYGGFSWNNDWWIFMFVVLNFVLVSIDLVLFFINKNRENKEIENANKNDDTKDQLPIK